MTHQSTIGIGRLVRDLEEYEASEKLSEFGKPI